MAKCISPTSYRSTTGNILYHTPVFTYYIEVSLIHKKYVELLYSSYKYSLNEIKLIKNTSYKKVGKSMLITSIELYGAPMKYLKSNKYTLLDLLEYKEQFKKKRKK